MLIKSKETHNQEKLHTEASADMLGIDLLSTVTLKYILQIFVMQVSL